MKEWKRLFRKEGYTQVEKNKFHNRLNSETVVFSDGLVFVYKNEEQVPLRQTLLPACISFIEENIYVRETRTLVGFLLKGNYFTVLDRSQVQHIHRMEQPENALKREIISAKFATDNDKFLVADATGRFYSIDPTDIETGEEILLDDYFTNFDGAATYLGKFGKEDALKEYFVVVTKHNKVKKTYLSEHNEFKTVLVGIDLRDGDEIIFAAPANDSEELILLSSDTKALRLSVSEFPPVERLARGYKAFDTQRDIADAVLVNPNTDVMSLAGGKGKLTTADQYPFGGRSTNGRMVADNTIQLLSLVDDVLVLDMEQKFAILSKDEIPHKHVKSTGVKLISTETSKILG